jgi:hypothetical protein
MVGIKIIEKEEDGEKLTFEEFQELSFDKKYDFVVFWMNEIASSIKELAYNVAEHQELGYEVEDEIKALLKHPYLKLVKSEIEINKKVRDILKGSVRWIV